MMIRFANPILLAGLAAVVLPVILHLLGRARFRSVEWGAMRFLPGSAGRRRDASRLRQWGLLFLRTALIAVLALTLARPMVRAGAGARPADTTLTVLILDRSASMSAIENDRSRMDRAKQAALNVLASLGTNQRAALLPMGGGEESAVEPTDDLQSLAQKISTMVPAAGRANLAHALNRAASLIQSTGPGTARIVIIGDRQATSWINVNPRFAHQWRQRFAASLPPPIHWIPIGAAGVQNVGIDFVRLVDPPAIAGLPVDIQVRVHNYGTNPRPAIELTLSDRKSALAHATLTLEPGQSQTISLQTRFNDTGSQMLVARIDANDPAFDNTFDYALDVIPQIPVLIVSGDQRNGAFRREADFLQLALRPFPQVAASTREAHSRKNPCTVRVVSPDQWSNLSLSQYRVVILANVPEISAEQVRSLEQYAYGGGGVIIAPGNLVRADDYNQRLYRNGTGLMPAMLQPATSADAPPTALLGIDLSHPIFRFLRGSPDPLPQASIARYFPASPHGGDARVLASYATGLPFVVEGAFGHGHVLLFTTAMDADWSNLPLSNFYLPFVQSSVKYLCAASLDQRNLSPGQTIAGSFPESVDQASLRIALPDSRQDSCDISPLMDRLEFRYGPVRQPGQYLVTATNGKKTLREIFLVRRDARESDLTALTAMRIKQLETILPINLAGDNGQGIAPPAADQIALWPWGIALVLLLAGLEMTLAARWGQERGK